MKSTSKLGIEDTLGDCTTNVFALTDARGLKWKKYSSHCSMTLGISDDPVLTAYATALRNDVLCVWQRLQSPNVSAGETQLLNCSKELIIFWYGEEPELNDIPGQHLKEIESGAYDNGLPTDYQDLFFKSIHNQVEKNLLNSKFVRLGKWFTKPIEQHADKQGSFVNRSTLAFSFSFFIHGASVVAASVEISQNQSICHLTKRDLIAASVKNAVSTKENCQVLLAPFGLNAQLTGSYIPDSEQRSVKIIEEWRKFLPIGKQQIGHEIVHSPNSCPAVVEVTLGDVKMHYPSNLVLQPIQSLSEDVTPILLTPPPSPAPAAPSEEQSSTTNKSKQQTPFFSKLINRIWSDTDKHEWRNNQQTKAEGNRNKGTTDALDPLWDFKRCVRHGNCGCISSSNSNRSKSASKFGNTNSIGAPSMSASSPSTVRPTVKWERSQSATNFHQRVTACLPSGRATPLVSGRATPKPSVKATAQTSQASISKVSLTRKLSYNNAEDTLNVPVSVPNKMANLDVDDQLSTTIKKVDDVPFVCIPHNKPGPSLLDKDSLMQSLSARDGASKQKSRISRYNIPSKIDIKIPVLPSNTLDPRQDEYSMQRKKAPSRVHNITANPLSKVEVSPLEQICESGTELKIERVPNQSLKRLASDSTQSLESTIKKVKPEPLVIPDGKEPLVSELGTRKSSQYGLSPHPASPKTFTPVFDNEGKQEQTSNLPTPTRQSKSSRLRKGSEKTESTTKSNESVFGFGNIKSEPSPTSGHFSPKTPKGSSASWMDAKDLVADSHDLDNLFAGSDEEENDLKKTPSTTLMNVPDPILGPPFVDDMCTKIITSQSTTNVSSGLTTQDLQQMFPTPPSLDSHSTAMSPALNVVPESLVNVTCSMALTSPENQMITIHENQNLEINLETKNSEVYTLCDLPKMQAYPLSENYLPVQPPSKKLVKLDFHHLKYHVSWETGSRPPVLSRHSSGNRNIARLPSTDSKDLLGFIPIVDSSYSLSTKSPTSQKQISELPVLSSNNRFHVPVPCFSPLPFSQMNQDFQSLVMNLTIADSFLNWFSSSDTMLANSSSAIKDSTLRLFSVYQNTLWKGLSMNEEVPDLFPGDQLSFHKQKPFVMKLAQKYGKKIPLMTNALIAMLLENLSSPVSAHHFKSTLSTCYVKKRAIVQDDSSADFSFSCVELLKELHFQLERALQKPLRKTAWDQPKIEGPLNFECLQKLSSKHGLQSISPATPLVVNFDGDVLTATGKSLKYWQPLSLEPFGRSRQVAYIVIAPETEFVSSHVRKYFRELSSCYESMNLGSHSPITKGIKEGIFRIGQKMVPKWSHIVVDEWFDQTDVPLMPKMKFIAQFCKSQLVRYLSSLTREVLVMINNPVPDRSNTANANPSSPAQGTTNQGAQSFGSSSATVFDDPPVDLSKLSMPNIVIYMIDPFQVLDNGETPSLWSYTGLMRSCMEMVPGLPEMLKDRVFFQIVPLEQVFQLSLNTRTYDTKAANTPELKNLAFTVYTKCREKPVYFQSNVKSLTVFSMASVRQEMVRKRTGENSLPSKIYVPPFTLTTPLKNVGFDVHSTQKVILSKSASDVNILYCCYCLSSDQQWLLGCCCDKKGEMTDTCMIKIHYPPLGTKRKTASWTAALKKLWKFFMEQISFSVQPWRVVLSRLGKGGVSELKDLYDIIHEEVQVTMPSQPASRSLSPTVDICVPCSTNPSRIGCHVLHSVTLTTVEMNSPIRLIPRRKFKNEDYLNSRIYITTPPKTPHQFARPKLKLPIQVLPSNDTGATDSNSALLQNSFDEDSEQDSMKPFFPLLPSPSTDTVFHQSLSSPSPDLSKPVMSPPSLLPSLMSPFQPIKGSARSPASRQSSPDRHGKIENASDMIETSLAVGYLVSGAKATHFEEENNTNSSQITKVYLRLHVSSNEAHQLPHPLDSSNNFEILKFVMEQFDVLSWLTVDPGTGHRQSSLPIHLHMLSNCRIVVNYMST